MPRKAGYRHNEDTRQKIQAAQIINRLQGHCMAKSPTMDASQVNAAKALLNKVLPDLQSVSLAATVDGHLTINVLPRVDVGETKLVRLPLDTSAKSG